MSRSLKVPIENMQQIILQEKLFKINEFMIFM